MLRVRLRDSKAYLRRLPLASDGNSIGCRRRIICRFRSRALIGDWRWFSKSGAWPIPWSYSITAASRQFIGGFERRARDLVILSGRRRLLPFRWLLQP